MMGNIHNSLTEKKKKRQPENGLIAKLKLLSYFKKEEKFYNLLLQRFLKGEH